jgi:hypothetical protein
VLGIRTMLETTLAYGLTAICPECGDRYQVIVRCYPGWRSQHCDAAHRLCHMHYRCTKCLHEWVENRSAGLAS